MGIALAFALTSVPAFLIARSLRRSDVQVNHLLARMMRTVGVLLAGGALGMLWAGGDPTRVLAVALGMALLVNGMAVAMFVAVLRAQRRNGRK
ncbi:MAG: hypothetical protein ACOY37_00275 [Pseudomonadota bacterium]